MEFTKSRNKFATEHTAENLYREEEARLRVNPSGMVERQTASRNDTMHVRMMEQLLAPGVQDAEEPDLSTEVARIARDLQQRCGAGTELEIVDLAFVLQCQRRDLVR
jgi:hypothetical protein